MIIIHNVLNVKWYKGLRNGKYNLNRTLHVIINCLLFLTVLILFISSIITSEKLFVFLGFESSKVMQRLHIASAYWFVILMGIHLGFYWNRFFKKVTFKNIYLNFGLALFIVFFGLYASFERNVGDKLFMRSGFDFWDFKENAAGFFLYSFSIILMYAIFTHYVINIRKKIRNFGFF